VSAVLVRAGPVEATARAPRDLCSRDAGRVQNLSRRGFTRRRRAMAGECSETRPFEGTVGGRRMPSRGEVMTPIARIFSLLTLSVVALAGAPPTNDLDTFIKAQMSQRQINGLSLAVIQDGRID